MELSQKKNSILYKAANIKLLIPEVKEAGLGIVPTSSTTNQLAIGDALAVACLKQKILVMWNLKISPCRKPRYKT